MSVQIVADGGPLACRSPFPFTDHLYINEADELRRLHQYKAAGFLPSRMVKRYIALMLRRYVPPGMPEPGEAA